jgi:alpha-beta hydrolase superfamily lysophospholipase
MVTELHTDTVTSADGTSIAIDVIGSGPPVVLVGGAFSYRRWKGFVELARLLADTYTVYGYDRRHRGDSSAGPVTTVEREIEDLAAVVERSGTPHVFGMSSGGVLTLRALAAGVPARSAVVYQPPFVVPGAGKTPPADFGQRLQQLVDSNARSAAVHYFMTRGMGAPAPIIALMRLAPFWKDLKAVAHTLPYDHAVMGETLSGLPLSEQPWADVTVPTLVVDGGKSPKAATLAADALVQRLAAGSRATLPGQGHNVAMSALAQTIRSFAGDLDTHRPNGQDDS